MVQRKVVEVMFNKNLPQQAKQVYKILKDANPKQAQQFINSIFTEYNKGIQSGIVATAATLGITNPAQAKELIKTGADKTADLFLPFYSATKDQIHTVNDYLDGKINKEEYYKRIGKGTLQQAVDGLLLVIGGKAASALAKSKVKTVIGNVVSTFERQGTKAAAKVAKTETIQARNAIIKQSPSAVKKIENAKGVVQKELDNTFEQVLGPKYQVDRTRPEDIVSFWFNNYLPRRTAASGATKVLSGSEQKLIEKASSKGVNNLTEDEAQSFIGLVRENADSIKRLAGEVGATKKDIPNLLKFINQLGSIIENSPNYIRNMASGMKKGSMAGIIANSGLSVYDLYQAYKEGGDNLIPRAVGDVTRGAAGLLPGGLVTKLLYGSLGYAAGDKLTRAGLKKLGVKDTTSDTENKEIEQGFRQPGLSDELPEYIEGQSGRKYHIVNDKIYDFATGKPVNIKQALTDADAYIQTQLQLTQDQIAAVNQQIADLEGAAQQGYNITPDQLEPLYQQRETLSTQANQLGQLNLNQQDYNSDNDLIEQVYNREVKPVEQQQQVQQQQAQQSYAQAYEQIFNKIANDTYGDIERLYTPENLALDYTTYMGNSMFSGDKAYISPQKFAQGMKFKAMKELAPKLHEKAQGVLKSIMEQQEKERTYQLELRKQGETERHQQSKDYISAYKEQETARHNLQTEGTDVYKAQSGRMSAQASVANAETNRAELPIKQRQLEINQAELQRKQQLLPYQQAEYAGAALSGASMSGMDLDTFINSNQSIMPQVFPEAFKQQTNQQPQQQSKPNIFQQGLNFITGQGQ